MKPLNSLAKRDLLAAQSFDPEELLAYAEQCYSEGKFGDAFEFYRKLKNRDGLLKVKKATMDIGDSEVLWRIEHTAPDLVAREDWSRCGEKAMELGKHRSAAYAFERIGDAERLAAAQREFKPPAEAPPSPGSPPPR